MLSRGEVVLCCEKRYAMNWLCIAHQLCTHVSLCFLQLVEQASKKFICIVDESKLVDGLGGSKGKQTNLCSCQPDMMLTSTNKCSQDSACSTGHAGMDVPLAKLVASSGFIITHLSLSANLGNIVSLASTKLDCAKI